MDFSPLDPGVADALARALGHAAPFSEAECAALEGPLTVLHARDVSELSHCSGLRHLELIASDVRDASALASLKRLRQLTIIATPLESLTPLQALPALEHLTLNFTHVQDATPLKSMPSLRKAELHGNPLTKESYNLVARRLSSTAAPQEAGPLLQVLPPLREDWEATRLLWEHGIAAGVARIDFRWWHFVSAGIPRLTPGPCDAVPRDPLLITEALGENPSLTLEALFQQAIQARDTPPQVGISQLKSRRPWGSSTEAASWVRASALDAETKEGLLQFIAHFPALTFYREERELLDEVAAESRVQLPSWLREIRQTLAGILPDQDPPEVMVRLQRFDFPRNTTTEPDSRWYSLVPGRYSGREEEQLLRAMNLVNVGISDELLWSQLLVRTDAPEDRAIYDFALERFQERQREGRDPHGTLGRVFTSYASMLSAINAVRLRRKQPIFAVQEPGTPA
ncbi:hypothetical protein [Archangium lansingense]|uniref:Leucine rich repeat (LRR) protein n=1 Tax=Archangium lansingense TaxID=2995310 RepID=A0ABT4ACW7_9BACT|nr:hypothetical protein [Archangium lansinium]MCY1079505.1 hypothetical protein [Archangium lansinium]